ncbi:MAG: NAD(P)-binding domain-containing protein [Planctomycetes bacterium]|nr:NAD(P)-binding domain-containing protein [Planctomycetota bacterium]
MAKIGVIGSGSVGDALAAGFRKHGHEVVRGRREPREGFKGLAETARFGDIVVLAVKGTAAESAVQLCGVANLAGKVVIDAMNPIADSPPVNGVLPFFTTHAESLMERLQKLAPKARFVKAFSCVGSAFMVNPKFRGGPPTMFICGNDAAAKETVKGILGQFGWDAEDVGGVEAARAIEPLCILWCLPGFLRNDWTHAFKMLR